MAPPRLPEGFRRAAVVLAASALALAATAQLTAQPSGWRMAGVVRDADGKPLRAAAITAENPAATPPTFTTTSDGRGRFGLIGLRSGQWILHVSAPGHMPFRAGFTVTRQSPRDPIVVTLQRTSPEQPLPLAGIDAIDLQARLAAAADLAAAGRAREAINAYAAIAARVPALTSVQLEIGRLSENAGDRARDCRL